MHKQPGNAKVTIQGTMPANEMKIFPLSTATECGSAETIQLSISDATLSITCQFSTIIWGSPRALSVSKIDDNWNAENLINNDRDDLQTEIELNGDTGDKYRCAMLQLAIISPDVVEQLRTTVE